MLTVRKKFAEQACPWSAAGSGAPRRLRSKGGVALTLATALQGAARIFSRVLKFASALPFIVLASTAAEPAKPPRLDRNDLLAFHSSDRAVHRVQKREDWQQRRAEILREMQTVMGQLPGAEKRCALDVQIEEEVDAGDHIRRTISRRKSASRRTRGLTPC